MPDADGYPTEEELKRIAEWDYKDLPGMMEFIEDLWEYNYFGWKQEGNEYYLSTAGWSGNESLICAMQDNLMFWSICWERSRRGGHFRFQIPESAMKLASKRKP
jgi:hypothetical protein